MADQSEPERSPAADGSSSDEETVKDAGEGGHLAELLAEEREQARYEQPPAPVGNGAAAHRYHALLEAQHEAPSDDGSADDLPRRVASPVDSLLSVPGASPSVQGSVLSSPTSSVLRSAASRPAIGSPSPSFRPFDRRFQSRIASPSGLTPRPSSPGFLSPHSRNVSLNSQFVLDQAETETSSPPWEVVRWTKLRKLTGQAFSEAGKRNFGAPTCLAVSASIVLGTSKGIILMFDYNQNLKMIIGPGTKAVESGAITSIAVSADHTTIGGGHADGTIFTWDTSRASRPFLHIPPLTPAQLQNRTADGHVPNVSITHLGFLGTRHTALVSSDDRGMAFAHLATRGTGPLGRTVRTSRILGRYPGSKPPPGKPLKPSTVLAFAPLPLANIDRATDSMGLTAMLTPYLLVIVSTTPVAQTQHKSPRPKEVTPHSAMSGCLAWFPAVKLKVPDPKTGSQTSKVKLVYCWSNVLTVLDVDEIPSETKDKPPSLSFRARSRWKCEEAIVAVQWLSRSVLTVLTITQRLIVLEDQTMRMTDGFDLLNKHIYHADLFSKQLYSLVEQHDEDDTTMHGVVADCFSMSFKAYKGRIFLMGFNDVSIGALSNWADRLIALMEHGDYIAAIQLATSYYTGDSDKLTIGLPDDAKLRHDMVREKLMEIISASLKYAFGQRKKKAAGASNHHLRELAKTCFIACQSVGDTDFLFEDMYEWYQDAETEGIFLETLEPCILDKSIRSVPPTVVKAMVTHFVSQGLESRLEEVLCHMDTATLDLDQVTLLCKQHNLYDALIYVWNQAMFDFITPLTDLLALLLPLMKKGEYAPSGEPMEEIYAVNVLKMFPYLSYALTGRVYPTEDPMPNPVVQQAKAEIYWFLFSGKSITWPKGSTHRLTTRPDLPQEPPFPYLRMILKYNAPDFLSCLNEAFEDSFLNDSPDKTLNGSAGKELSEEQVFGSTVDRQYIVSILTEIMNPADFSLEDTIYLDMFISRNLPKYPQYLLLPGSTLTNVLTGLCNYPGEDLADDAQLSAEYLLSVYHPPDISSLIPLLKKAGFYRVLKRIYRTDQQYGRLIRTYFEDPSDRDEVFECISDCLRSQTGATGRLTKRQLQDVHEVVKEYARDLVGLDPGRAASAVEAGAPELHRHLLASVEDEPGLQHAYLRTILEPGRQRSDRGDGQEEALPAEEMLRQGGSGAAADRDLIEQYIRLMCQFEPAHVSDYVGLVQSTNLRLETLLPTMEEMGVIDAAIVLMAREGQIPQAMERLIKHLQTLESAFRGLLSGAASSPIDQARTLNGDYASVSDLHESAEGLMDAARKYVYVGIWLCQGQTKMAARGKQKAATDELSPEESMWLSLVNASVHMTQSISSLVPDTAPLVQGGGGGGQEDGAGRQTLDTDKLVGFLRSLVQHTFTALLTATSTPTAGVGGANASKPGAPGAAATAGNNIRRSSTAPGNNLSFLRILRAFLTQAAASSPSLAELRGVLASIFSAYAYEESILRLSGRLLERSLFSSVSHAVALRQRGWRPRGSTCEACGRRVTGPGVAGSSVLEAWEEREEREAIRRDLKRKALAMAAGAAGSNGDGSGVGISVGDLDGGGTGASTSSSYAYFNTDHAADVSAAGGGKGKGKAAEPARPRGEFQVRDEPEGDAGAAAAGQGEAGDDSAAARGFATPSPTVGTKPAAVFGPSRGGRREKDQPLGPLVVLACRHIYHQSCLDALHDDAGGSRETEDEEFPGSRGVFKRYRCPIDG
ncbi:hypothetical protein RB601_003376 [Gaeumannomyces tritici]